MNRYLNFFSLHVEFTSASRPWLEAMAPKPRMAQIVACFSPQLGVEQGGFGQRRREGGELVEKNLDFYYTHFEGAAAEFPRIGEELGFPPGSTLTHVAQNALGEYEFTDLHQW